MTKPNSVAHQPCRALLLALLALWPSGARAQQSSAAARPELVLEQGHHAPITEIVLLPGEQMLASADQNNQLILWDAASGVAVRRVKLPPVMGYSSNMQLSADGRRLEFGYAWEQRSAVDIQSGKLLDTLPAVCPGGAQLRKLSPAGTLAICTQRVNAADPQSDLDYFLWDTQNQRRTALFRENVSAWLAFQFAPDGKWLAVTERDELRILNASSGAVIRTFHDLELVGVSPDGQRVYLSASPAGECGCDGQPNKDKSDLAVGGAVEVWDARFTKLQRRVVGRQWLGFAPGGQTVVVQRRSARPQDATLEFWDVELTAVKQQIPGAYRGFRFAPGGGQQVMLELQPESPYDDGRTKTLALYDWQSGARLAQLADGQDVMQYAFSADGATITTVNQARVAKLWDGQTGALRQTLPLAPAAHKALDEADHAPRFPDDPKNVLITRDGLTVYAVHGAQVLTGDLRNASVRATPRGLPVFTYVPSVIVYAQDALAVAAGGLLPTLWDLNTWQTRPLPVPDPKAEAADEDVTRLLSPDGKLRFELRDFGKAAQFVDAATGQSLRALRAPSGRIFACVFSPDSKLLLTMNEPSEQAMQEVHAMALTLPPADEKQRAQREARMQELLHDNTLQLWDVATGQRVRSLAFKGEPNEAKFLDTGAQFVTVHSEISAPPNPAAQMLVTLWDTQTGAMLNRFGTPAQLSLSPDGALTLRQEAGKLSALDSRTGKLKWQADKLALASLDEPFLADGAYLACIWSGGEKTELRLLETQTGRERLRTQAEGVLSDLSVSADGRLFLLAHEATASCWDLQTGQRQWSADILKGPHHAAFAPNGRHVALQIEPDVIELREAVTGQVLLTLTLLPGAQAGQAEWIAHTPDGHYLASSGAEQYIRWRVDGKLLPAAAYAKEFNRPELVRAALRGGR